MRGLSYRLREWGELDAPPLLLLHGVRDSSASFQFMVDALRGDWRVTAPDWRGHGGSSWTPGSYWLADFLADLDALVPTLFGDRPTPVVGHSMGGNIASLYAALRPTQVSALVMLDALGNTLDRSPVSVEILLEEMRRAAGPPKPARSFADIEEMAARLVQADRRLRRDRAAYLAGATAIPLPGGAVTWANDPTCVRSLPTLHSTEDWGAAWRLIRAPVCCILASDPRPVSATGDPDEVRTRTAYFPAAKVLTLAETGHNLHHDAPEALARAVEDFLAGAPLEAPANILDRIDPAS